MYQQLGLALCVPPWHRQCHNIVIGSLTPAQQGAAAATVQLVLVHSKMQATTKVEQSWCMLHHALSQLLCAGLGVQALTVSLPQPAWMSICVFVLYSP